MSGRKYYIIKSLVAWAMRLSGLKICMEFKFNSNKKWVVTLLHNMFIYFEGNQSKFLPYEAIFHSLCHYIFKINAVFVDRRLFILQKGKLIFSFDLEFIVPQMRWKIRGNAMSPFGTIQSITSSYVNIYMRLYAYTISKIKRMMNFCLRLE